MIVRKAFLRWLTLLVFVAIAAAVVSATPRLAAAGTASLGVYRGLGTWVDIYDPKAWRSPAAAVADMKRRGVRTLYVETANYHTPATIFKPAAMSTLIEEAHRRKMKVVAWYLPGLRDLTRDKRRSFAAIRFRTRHGHRFDGFALDIEDSRVKPASLRTYRLTRLSRDLRSVVGSSYTMGAIIPSPVGMKMHPTYWPEFPYTMLAEVYDVFLPMGYYTFHVSGYWATYNETLQNVSLLRAATQRPSLPIHVIGGLAADSSLSETTAYVRALRETGSLGGGMYDWSTSAADDWSPLRYARVNPVQTPAMPFAFGFSDPVGNCPEDTSHPKEVFYAGGPMTGARQLSWRVWDAQANEIRLCVNWRTVAVMSPGPDGAWSETQTITLPDEVLSDTHRNVIGFVAAGEWPKWSRWGVRDVTLSEVAPQ